ncbi:hypothetical protein R80B4_03065 [Fibrobacteres bacterium R8-0-B4]
MIAKIFIDSDVILDLLARRVPFYDYSAEIFTLVHKRKIEVFTTAVVLSNVFYILRKINGRDKAKEQLRALRLLIRILPISERIVDNALNSKFNDFEDGLQYFTAKDCNIQAIITRNIKDYKERDIIIQTPEEYLTRLAD